MVKHLQMLTLCALALAPCAARAQTPLTVGDIAITGVNPIASTVNGTPANRDFSFILLKNIAAGTSISFTDFGWRSDAPAFQTALPCGAGTGSVTDGALTWTSTTAMSYGTQVLIRCLNAPTTSAGSITAMQATYNSTMTPPLAYIQMSSLGESLIAYTGSISSPNLLTGIKCATQGWETSLLNCDYNPTPSVRPSALTGNSAFVIPMQQTTPYGRLKPSVTIPSNPLAALAAIADPSNWDIGTTAYVLPSANPVTPLPLKLIRFTGTVDRGHSILDWSVGTENDVLRYVIERSNDTRTWLSIGAVNAKNVSGSTYQFTDDAALQTNLYRLRMEDIDGATTYSNVVSTHITGQEHNIRVYPTKFTNQITISTEGEEVVTILMTDQLGRTVRHTKSMGKETTLHVDDLAAGMYLVKIGNVVFKVLK